MAVTVVASGGNIGVATQREVLSSAPITWDEMVAEYGIGYNYPQPTGATTSYRTGDDADIETSVFTNSVRAANDLKPSQSLESFLVLNNNNSFGNTDRFTDDSGGQTYANDYVIDHFTGLGWYRVELETNYWLEQIDAALASTAVSYSDWFLPNIKQISSGRNNGTIGYGFNYAPFSLVTGYWTSTTLLTPTTNAISTWNSHTTASSIKETRTRKALICRKHF